MSDLIKQGFVAPKILYQSPVIRSVMTLRHEPRRLHVQLVDTSHVGGGLRISIRLGKRKRAYISIDAARAIHRHLGEAIAVHDADGVSEHERSEGAWMNAEGVLSGVRPDLSSEELIRRARDGGLEEDE